MKSKNIFNLVVKLAVACMLSFLISGCFGNTSSTSPQETVPPPEGTKTKKTTAVYHDFEDVLIPLELSVVKNRTVIVSTPGFTSGILTLKGRVERKSLFNFFNTNMQRDNWDIISQIKSPGTTIMVWQKSSRTAVITIRDEQINTYVEVGVAPTVTVPVDVSESTLIE